MYAFKTANPIPTTRFLLRLSMVSTRSIVIVPAETAAALFF